MAEVTIREGSMADEKKIRALFVDIGGVLLSNGWDRAMRKKAAESFSLDFEEMDERHHLTFGSYEEGKMNLEDYLSRVVFYKERPFSRDAFMIYIFAQSYSHPEMCDLIGQLKERYHLRVATISNEGRELTIYRIERFGLKTFVDFFVNSCFVHFRKPDLDIYRIALDLAQVEADEAVYIDDRLLFVETARKLCIKSIHHREFETTRRELAGMGLS
jgi:putative hydrolase of the HAD superfamily